MGDFDWSQAGQGGLGGGVTGASIGTSIAPGIGTAIGAGVGLLAGGLLGGFGGDGGAGAQRAREQQLYDMAKGYKDVGGINYQDSGWRDAQMRLYGQLSAQSRGQGPSAATTMLQQQADRGAAQQAGLAAGAAGRGANPGAALLNASQQQAGLQMQAASDASLARTREQMEALNQLASLTGQARQQDLGAQEANMNNAHRNWANRFGALSGATGMMAGQVKPGMGTSLMAGGMATLPMFGQQMGANRQASQAQAAPAAVPSGPTPTPQQFAQFWGYGQQNPQPTGQAAGPIVDPWA